MCPLRPATDHSLGGPLPHQLANRPRAPPPAHCCFSLSGLCGISPGFPGLFPTRGQVTHVLLTRTPLYSPGCPGFLVRLACVRRAASVDSEPGSNSRLILLSQSPFRSNSAFSRTRLVRPTRFSMIYATNQVSKRKPYPPQASKAFLSASRRSIAFASRQPLLKNSWELKGTLGCHPAALTAGPASIPQLLPFSKSTTAFQASQAPQKKSFKCASPAPGLQ